MRVVEPKDLGKTTQPHKRKVRKRYVLPALTLGLAAFTFGIFTQTDIFVKEVVAPDVSVTDELMNVIEEPAMEQRIDPRDAELEGNEFRLFYDNLRQANTDTVDIPPPITGDDIVDTRIREIAEARGYKLRAVAVGDLSTVDGYELQEDAQQPWLNMKRALEEQGLELVLVSGYRSIDDQRSILLERLANAGASTTKIADGLANDAVDEVLELAAPPGYSKHHTGYTIDLFCPGTEFRKFSESPCHAAMIADNFALPRQFGFIPSYPDDAQFQGPTPEAWEYVYVGDAIL
jgi:hypothetical protein